MALPGRGGGGGGDGGIAPVLLYGGCAGRGVALCGTMDIKRPLQYCSDPTPLCYYKSRLLSIVYYSQIATVFDYDGTSSRSVTRAQ